MRQFHVRSYAKKTRTESFQTFLLKHINVGNLSQIRFFMLYGVSNARDCCKYKAATTTILVYSCAVVPSKREKKENLASHAQKLVGWYPKMQRAPFYF